MTAAIGNGSPARNTSTTPGNAGTAVGEAGVGEAGIGKAGTGKCRRARDDNVFCNNQKLFLTTTKIKHTLLHPRDTGCDGLGTGETSIPVGEDAATASAGTADATGEDACTANAVGEDTTSCVVGEAVGSEGESGASRGRRRCKITISEMHKTRSNLPRGCCCCATLLLSTLAPRLGHRIGTWPDTPQCGHTCGFVQLLARWPVCWHLEHFSGSTMVSRESRKAPTASRVSPPNPPPRLLKLVLPKLAWPTVNVAALRAGDAKYVFTDDSPHPTNIP